MKTTYLRTLAFATFALLMTTAYADQDADRSHHKAQAKVMHFDVAESGSKFSFDEAPLLPSGFPAYGNAFITQGYIYPAGTLGADNGVNPNGSPEFP